MRQLKPLHAERKFIEPGFSWMQMHVIDVEKVRLLRAHLSAGGAIPPVVLVTYGSTFMPIDGHHRMSASWDLGRGVDSWQVDGRDFDKLCRDRLYNAHDVEIQPEELVLCDGVPAIFAAQAWRVANDPAFNEMIAYRLWSERTF